ncbi:MAG: hypothetical protein E7032_08115 [Akkermansiaceae bacterium]|nr:hypothetical protein [Akkermansiaceae bacterium]
MKVQFRRRCWIAALSVIALAILVRILYTPGMTEDDTNLLEKCETYQDPFEQVIGALQDKEAEQAAQASKEMAQRNETLQRIVNLANDAARLTADFKTKVGDSSAPEDTEKNADRNRRRQEALTLKNRAESERRALASLLESSQSSTSATEKDAATAGEHTPEDVQDTAGDEQVEAGDDMQAYAPPFIWGAVRLANADIYAEYGDYEEFADETDASGESAYEEEDAQDAEGSGEEAEGEGSGEEAEGEGVGVDEGTDANLDYESSSTSAASEDVNSLCGRIHELLEKNDLPGARRLLKELRDNLDKFYQNAKAESQDANEALEQYRTKFETNKRRVDELLANEPEATDLTEQTKDLLKKADEELTRFETMGKDKDLNYELAYKEKEPEQLPPLQPGEADFSIVTTKEMADGLVRNLVEQWAKYHSGATNKVESVEYPNGWRYVLQRNGGTQTVDVIDSGSPTGAHVYISPQQNLRMAELARGSSHRTICLDALVFMNADAERPVMKLDDIRRSKKYLMPEGTIDRAAAELFNFVPKAGDVQLNEYAPALPSDGLLAVTYHNRARFGGKPVSIEYNAPRNCLPDATSISSRHYLYAFDIVMETLQKLKGAAKELKDSFEHYIVETKDATALVKEHGFVPLYSSAVLEPELLTQDDLPVQDVLEVLEEQNKAALRGLGYLSTRSTVKGVLLPYPVRFPTNSDEEKRCVLRDDDLALLKRMVSENLKELQAKYGTLLVVVTGHADVRGRLSEKEKQKGKESVNVKLAINRAARFLASSLCADIAPDYVSAPKGVKSNENIKPYTNSDGSLTVMTYGCSDDYYLISKEEAETYGTDKGTLDKVYQPDRRVNIYVIVPDK